MHPTPIFDKTRVLTGGANVAEASFRNETPEQRFDHRIIAHKYRVAGDRRSRRADPKTYIRIRELERLFFDRYGAMLPNDDAGLDDIFVMANHLAQLAEPDQRITAWLRRWAPWYGEDSTVALIRSVTPTPIKWRADVLARQLGLDYATRTRLRITTIGAIDCGKAKRAALRRERNNAAKRASRAKGGAASHATCAARTEPWKALGISPSTYYRKRRNGARDTNSGTACPKDIVVDAKQCHDAEALPPVSRAPRGAQAQVGTARHRPSRAETAMGIVGSEKAIVDWQSVHFLTVPRVCQPKRIRDGAKAVTVFCKTMDVKLSMPWTARSGSITVRTFRYLAEASA
jgi:hypothetical protein